MTEVAPDEDQRISRPKPIRWDLAPGNYVHLYWVSGLGRTVETHGVIRTNGGGCVKIAPNAFSPLEKATEIHISRIREVDVITEGEEGKNVRKRAWEILKDASKCINRVSTWDPDGFMQAMTDLALIFPKIRLEPEDEDS